MYIPNSNIIEVNYVNGGQFAIKSTQVPYTGYYHKDNDNNYWSGKTHTNESVLLELLNSVDNIDWNKWTNISGGYTQLNPKVLPPTVITPDFIQPTDNDYINGFFLRFILKPVISSQINDFIEVNESKYNTLIQNKDLQVLYKSTNLVWKLTGPLYDGYENNIRVISGIIDTNKRSIAEAEKFIPNLSLYFTDLTQFGKPS